MKKQKGFSLIELLVVMAIFAVFLTLAFYAIQIVQQRSRDSQRIAMLADMGEQINKYRRDRSRYPAASAVQFASTTFSIQGSSAYNITLQNFLRSATTTTNQQTRYYYEYANGTFGLCVKLESGKTQGVGERACPSL